MSVTPAKLEDWAWGIPSMGGRVMAGPLRSAAAAVPEGQAIVEVGAWLGSGTAQLALGVMDSGKATPIHCYDRWRANGTEVEKIRRKAQIETDDGQDLLPMFRDYLAPFDAEIICHQGMLKDAEWTGGPIGLYVDDAAKQEINFRNVLRVFGPSWIPGETVLILMDYHHWKFQDKPKSDHKFQTRFVAENARSFEMLIEQHPRSSACSLRYIGGLEFSSI